MADRTSPRQPNVERRAPFDRLPRNDGGIQAEMGRQGREGQPMRSPKPIRGRRIPDRQLFFKDNLVRINRRDSCMDAAEQLSQQAAIRVDRPLIISDRGESQTKGRQQRAKQGRGCVIAAELNPLAVGELGIDIGGESQVVVPGEILGRRLQLLQVDIQPLCQLIGGQAVPQKVLDGVAGDAIRDIILRW